MPSIAGLPALDIAGTVSAEEEAAVLAWSGLYALVEENKPNIPSSYGVYVISAGQPVDPADWDPPRGNVVQGACPFATRHSLCRQRSEMTTDDSDTLGARRKARPKVDLTNDADHNWLQRLRQRRNEARQAEASGQEQASDLTGDDDRYWTHPRRAEVLRRLFVRKHGREPNSEELREWAVEIATRKKRRRLEDFLE